MSAYERMTYIFDSIKTDRIKAIGKLKNQSFVRTRKMPFDEFLKFIIFKKGKTTTMELNEYFKDILQKENTVTKQAFSKQRRYLNPLVFTELNKDYISNYYSSANFKRYKGHIIAAIDGTYIEVPNTKELQEEYDCQSTGQPKHRNIARALASCIYDVENNMIIDSRLGKRSYGERELAKENIKAMLNILASEKDIIIVFDRGYFSFELLLMLMEANIKYLFRLPSRTLKKERNALKSDDEQLELLLTPSRLFSLPVEVAQNLKDVRSINARMVQISLTSGEKEYLLTNISESLMCTKEIGDLYYKRWGIELAYDVIKNKLNIENISGKSKLIVEQDFYAQILLFNMLEDLRHDADNVVKDKNNKGKKYDYKVNMNILVGTFRSYVIMLTLEEDDIKRQKMYMSMIDEIVSNLVPIRPNRQNPRKPYDGANKYYQNAKRNS